MWSRRCTSNHLGVSENKEQYVAVTDEEGTMGWKWKHTGSITRLS